MKSLKNQTCCKKFITITVITIIAIAILWQLCALLVEVSESYDSLLILKATNSTTKESDEQKRERYGRYETNYRQYVSKVVLYTLLHIIAYVVMAVSTYKSESMTSIFVGSLLLTGTILAKLIYSARTLDIVINSLILLFTLISLCMDGKKPIGQQGSTNRRKETMQMKNIVIG